MEFFLTLVFWAVILLIALYFAQIFIGLVIWIFIGAVWLVTLPFTWAYGKIKESKEA